MAYKITAGCISCNRCLSVCPNDAVKMIDGLHIIDTELCTNCAGSIHTVPQCKAVCPTYDGCVEDTIDYWESWFKKYNQLIAKLTNKQDYWECWYKTYSQKFSEQLQKNQVTI